MKAYKKKAIFRLFTLFREKGSENCLHESSQKELFFDYLLSFKTTVWGTVCAQAHKKATFELFTLLREKGSENCLHESSQKNSYFSIIYSLSRERFGKLIVRKLTKKKLFFQLFTLFQEKGLENRLNKGSQQESYF